MRDRGLDYADYMRIRVIGTYANTKQLIELLDREYVGADMAMHFTPQLQPHPGHGTTNIVINFLHGSRP